jgi:hypothetical protein
MREGYGSQVAASGSMSAEFGGGRRALGLSACGGGAIVGCVTELGRLEQVDPRLIWEREDTHFTPWLLSNAERLAEALGIELELESAEHAVGGFSLDLIGRDLSNGAVLVVENQLASTDHSHLGQLLTYAAGTGASTIIWIATTFREEHRQALDWLNENSGEDKHFFGVELEVVRIGDSAVAPLFKLVAQPNDWQKHVRVATQARGSSTRGALYVQFWTRFYERLKQEHPEWRRWTTPSPQNWIDLAAPVRGTHYSLSFGQNERLRSELCIASGDDERNRGLLAAFQLQQSALEQAYGESLSWEELPGRRSCRIADYKDGCSITEIERYEEFIDWFFASNQRFRRALAAVAADVPGLEIKAGMSFETSDNALAVDAPPDAH